MIVILAGVDDEVLCDGNVMNPLGAGVEVVIVNMSVIGEPL